MTEINDNEFRPLEPNSSWTLPEAKLRSPGEDCGVIAQNVHLSGGYDFAPIKKPYVSIGRMVGPARVIARWTRTPNGHDSLLAATESLARALLLLPEAERRQGLLDLGLSDSMVAEMVRDRLQEFRQNGGQFLKTDAKPATLPLLEVHQKREGKWVLVAKVYIDRTDRIGISSLSGDWLVTEQVEYRCRQIVVSI